MTKIFILREQIISLDYWNSIDYKSTKEKLQTFFCHSTDV